MSFQRRPLGRGPEQWRSKPCRRPAPCKFFLNGEVPSLELFGAGGNRPGGYVICPASA